MKSNLNSYFPGFNRFIGIKSNSNLYNEEKKYISNEMKITNCSSEYLYKYNLLNNDIVFIVDDESVFPESLMASFINKIKHYLLERKKHVISVSIAYPDYYTLSELEGYTRSLRIADVDSYHIISEQTAIALYYGFMNFKNLKESENIYKIFVDFGYSKCTLGVSAFQKSSFRVLQTFSDPNCGGRMMDMLLVNYLSKMFFSKHKVDILSNKKSVLKLLTEVQKSRKILTSNKDIHINVEFIINELDLTHNLNREEFEKICAPVFEKFELLLLSCRKYIDNMKLTDKITIEMAGECMRTPLAQTLIKRVFNQGISKTLLIDECVAKGCSIYSSLIFQSLDLKGFQRVFNVNPYSIYLEIFGNNYMVINRNESLPCRKSMKIKIKKNSDNSLKFSYVKDELVYVYGENVDPLIRIYQLNQIENYYKDKIEDMTINIELNFEISGQFCVDSLKLGLNKQDIDIIKSLVLRDSFVDRSEKFVSDLCEIERNLNKKDKFIAELDHEMNEMEKKTYELKNLLENKGEIREKYMSSIEEILSFIHNRDNNDQFEIKRLKANEYNSLLKDIRSFIDKVPSNIQRKNMNDRESDNNDSEMKHFNSNINSDETNLNYYKLAQDLVNKINHYRNLLDEEYVKILSGVPSKMTEESISLVSDKLSKYQIISNSVNLQLEKSLNMTYTKQELFEIIQKIDKDFPLNW